MTTLSAGDIAIIGYTGEGQAGSADDSFAFVLLRDVDASTVINFTDSEYQSNVLNPNEGNVRWTSGGALSTGTVVTIAANSSTGVISATSGTAIFDSDSGFHGFSFALSTAGDQLIAYQGQAGSGETPIAALNTRPNGWDPTAALDGSDSQLPPGLTDGVNALHFVDSSIPDEYDNGYYNGPTTGTVDFLRTAINTASNWVGQNTAFATSPFATSFSVSSSLPPQDIAVLGGATEIPDGDITPTNADGTAFGAADVTGGTTSRSYTIANQGGDPLNISSIQITGAHASDFTVTTSPVGAVGGSGNATLTIEFDPSAGGARTATVTIVSDDPDEGSYSFDVRGSGANPGSATTLSAGGVAFVGYNADGSDAFAFVLIADVTAGTVIKFTDGGWTGSTFRQGEGAVQWTAPSDISAGTVITYDSAADGGGLDWDVTDTAYFSGSFGIGTAGDQIIAYQGSADGAGSSITNIAALHYNADTFDTVYSDATGVSLLPTGLIDGDTAISFANGATEWDSGVWNPSSQPTEALLRQAINNENNWTGSDDPQTLPAGPYTPSGGPVEPDIELLGNAQPIASGDTTASWTDSTVFTPAAVDGGSVTVTYTVRNTGSDTLNIASIALSGDDSAAFAVSNLSSSSVAAGAAATFDVTFDPAQGGRHDATVTVVSDDPDEASYSFAIAGSGIATGGGTDLSAGGAAIVGYNSTGADNFAFVLLRDVVAGTELNFTDGGWTGTTYRAGEGAGRWVAPTDISAGTIIAYDDLLTNGGEDFFPVPGTYYLGSFGPSSAGDQIMLYQGEADATGTNLSNVFALHFEAAEFDTVYADITGSSLVPTGLTDGVNAISLGENPVVTVPEWENGVYSGSTNLSFTALLAAISDEANWTTSHSVTQTLPSGRMGNAPPSVDVNSGLAVTEGGGVTLTTAMLLATDLDGDTLTYTVTSLPAAGTLSLSGSALAVNDTFTQQDVTDGLVTWTDSGAGALATYDIGLSLSDGQSSLPVTVGVAVTLTDDAPLLSGLTPDIAWVEDTTGFLNLSQLVYADEEDAVNTLTIDASTGTFQAIAADPAAGVSVSLVDTNTVTIQGTQAAINAYLDLNLIGPITYQSAADLSGDNADTLTFTGYDGANTTSLGTMSIDIASDPELTVSIASASVSEGLGTTTATVTRDGDTTDALLVTLSSDDVSEATAPTTVLIAAGQASASFTVAAVDDLLIDGAQSVTITASAAGYDNGSDTLDVTDDDVLTATDDLFTFADTVTGAVNALDVLAANPTTIDIFAPLAATVTAVNGSAANVGATVTLASGNSVMLSASGQLTYTISADNEALPVGESSAETFTYQLNGASTATVTLRVNGLDNDDVFSATAGSDGFDGGVGINTITYEDALSGVTVDLADSTQNAGAAAGDVLANFQVLIGSEFDDILSGTGNAEEINALDGNDVLVGRGAGDTLHGGDGYDWLSYADSSSGVAVNLGTGSASGGDAAGDSFTGIERVVGSAHADTLTGSAEDDLLRGGGGDDSLVGGDGRDHADYRGAGGAVQVDLNAGTATGAGGNDTLSGIEIVIGTSFDDTLTGNGDANVLRGGLGADTLSGAAGADWADYRTSAAPVSVNLDTGATAGGEAAGDELDSIENLLGSAGDDTLTGNSLVNVLRGGAGADVLTGTGNDWLDYRGSDAAVTVDLANNIFSGGDADGDVVTGIPNILGSDNDDRLTGDSGDNLIRGGEGNDTMVGGAGLDWLDYRGAEAAITLDAGSLVAGGWAAGDSFSGFEGFIGSEFADAISGSGADEVIRGGAGADTLDGGLGVDWLDYRGINGPVTVSLTAGTGTDGDAAGDVLSGFENLIGTGFGDTLEGDSGNNMIRGGDGSDSISGLDGNDTLLGGGGNDTFIFGAGNDAIYGDQGVDVFDASGRASTDFSLVTNSATHVTLTDLGSGDVDEIYFVESIVFADTTILI